MFEDLTERIRRLVDARAVYLFGSQAKGTARADSDIDLCVIAPTASKREHAGAAVSGVGLRQADRHPSVHAGGMAAPDGGRVVVCL